VRSIVVGIADLQISADPDTVLVTYALGSCIAITAYEPHLKVGGMLHYLLPDAAVNEEKARIRPAMFGNTGIPLLLGRMYRLGCKKEDLIVTVAGGGQICNVAGVFGIGERNYQMGCYLLSKDGIMVRGEDVGGRFSRSVYLELATGRVVVKTRGREVELCSP
jgi:chemotaxis protein CheD